jgi:hypothetical protein
MKQLHLKPAEGALVRHPDGRRLADEGETVIDSPHWQRRLAAGDVVETKPAKAAKPKTETATRE